MNAVPISARLAAFDKLPSSDPEVKKLDQTYKMIMAEVPGLSTISKGIKELVAVLATHVRG